MIGVCTKYIFCHYLKLFLYSTIAILALFIFIDLSSHLYLLSDLSLFIKHYRLKLIPVFLIWVPIGTFFTIIFLCIRFNSKGEKNLFKLYAKRKNSPIKGFILAFAVLLIIWFGLREIVWQKVLSGSEHHKLKGQVACNIHIETERGFFYLKNFNYLNKKIDTLFVFSRSGKQTIFTQLKGVYWQEAWVIPRSNLNQYQRKNFEEIQKFIQKRLPPTIPLMVQKELCSEISLKDCIDHLTLFPKIRGELFRRVGLPLFCFFMLIITSKKALYSEEGKEAVIVLKSLFIFIIFTALSQFL